MNHPFKAISISYKTAPVAIREPLALSDEEARSFLLKLQEILGIQEALLLSTCNRTELYYSSENDIFDDFIKLLLIEKGIERHYSACPYHHEWDKSEKQLDYAAYFQNITQSEEAVRHLFSVAMGLESQVVGDIQISNQVKRAYQVSADLNLATAFLHRLLHTIFFTHKRVAQETNFRDGAASVSYAATEILYDSLSHLPKPKVLMVGLGEIGADAVRNLKNVGHWEVVLINRTEEKALSLAQELGYRSAPLSDLEKELAQADALVSSVMMQSPLITKKMLSELPLAKFRYLIDLSIPRSIEPETEEIEGVNLFNIDHIQNRTQATIERRKEAIPAVEALIAESIEEFSQWLQEMTFSPTIQKLKQALEQIRQAEIARHLKNLDEKELGKVEMITKNMMQKIIKLPVLQLKAACKRGEAENLADVLNDLFNLENVNSQG
ncbi:glutamyl-tRNA reductase [Hugenholtzia roseola]|uniref:glutamyl-tRNA reductase n=1 Tax=Hugenholtzia roseola TaxID=1002 RepID=UPI000400DE58|nr:glutamyl-tRNA reductase [Hugenholtzia roseola]